MKPQTRAAIDFTDSDRDLGRTGVPLRSPAEKQNPENRRRDPRTELKAQAFVSMVGLASRAFRIHEISRGGMFLAFGDARTALDMEHESIEVGSDLEISFSVVVDGTRDTFSVRARIRRITRKGIGVQFLTRNPPQLGALREIFAGPEEEWVNPNPAQAAALGANRPRVIQKPADDSGWQDWEIL